VICGSPSLLFCTVCRVVSAQFGCAGARVAVGSRAGVQTIQICMPCGICRARSDGNASQADFRKQLLARGVCCVCKPNLSLGSSTSRDGVSVGAACRVAIQQVQMHVS
jgi:hypothetical protein